MFVITEDLVLLVLVSLRRNIKLKHTTNEMQKKKKNIQYKLSRYLIISFSIS